MASAPDRSSPRRRRRPPRTTGRDRERLLRVEAAPDGTLTVLDKRTGSASSDCTGSRTSPTSATSTTSARSTAPPRVGRVRHRPRAPGRSGRPGARTPQLTVSTIVRLIDGIGRVEFPTTIDNRTEDHRLRATFPVGEASDVRAEGQFALVHRPLAPPAPKTEWCEPPDPTHHTLGAVALGPLALAHQGPAGIRGAPQRDRCRAVPDAAPLRRHDLAARRRDRHPPGLRRPADPDARRPVPRPPRARVRAAPGRGRARRRRAAPRGARLSLRVPDDVATGRASIRRSRSTATSCSRA